jgi:NodT family efflux transporter outer membrane factor (OMF) lipoprotein
VSLDAGWDLDLFGANRSALDASDATERASAATLGDVQVSVAAEVALSYITLRSAQARLAIASENLASQQETLQITQWRLQAGLVSSLEAEQARAATEQTRAQLPALQTGIDVAGHALAVLTGQPPADLVATLDAAGPIPQARDDLVPSLPAELLRQRPDVRAAEHQVSAAFARAAEADARRAPNFQLGGSLGLSALTLATLTNGASIVTALLASVSMPLFDGGAGLAQVRAQEAALDQARVAYQAAVLTALRDVEDALAAQRGDRERLQRLRIAAEAATGAALMARQRYSSGLIDFQVVLETQRTRLSTQDSVAIASADVGADHVRLFKALGGGWRSDHAGAAPPAVASDTATVNRNSHP